MSFIGDLFGLAAPQAAIVSKIVEIVAVLSMLGGVVLYLEHRGATHELQDLQKSSTKLLASANKQIAETNTQHAAAVKANQEKLDAALAANTALQSSLTQRVRDFDTYRRAHPDVARPAGGSGPASSGSCGVEDCGDLAVRLAESGVELAGSNGQLTAALQSCQRERDSLTGLPRAP